MTEAAPISSVPLEYQGNESLLSNRHLLRQLLWLALPILVEHILHMFVGLTDVYLAGHLKNAAAPATAAIGTVSYFLWFIGLMAGAIGMGSTAIIARAIGARHRSLANSVCGQTVTAAIVLGISMAAALAVFAPALARITGLSGDAHEMALFYFRVLSLSLPFSTLMFVANACLRGAGDTVTPAIAMVVVDVVNILVSASLTLGWWGLPEMGYPGIAIGTVAAYVVGGLLQFIVLIRGRGGIRLHLHRMKLHWLTMKRILRIGIPSGAEGALSWGANFIIVFLINVLDPTNVMGSAHIITVRIESLSFMAGLAVATAVATMVGQSLGMRNPERARRSAVLAFAVGGGVMTAWGLVFIFFGDHLARFVTDKPDIAALAARCLFVTGFVQMGFAAAMIFGGALRGAGDTMGVMLISLGSVLALRLTGVLIVGWWLRMGLTAIWIVLSAELLLRGLFMLIRFARGRWKTIRV